LSDQQLADMRSEARRVRDQVTAMKKVSDGATSHANIGWVGLRILSIVASLGTAAIAAVQAATHSPALAWYTVAAAFVSTAVTIIMTETRTFDWLHLKREMADLIDDLDNRAGSRLASCTSAEDYRVFIGDVSEEIKKIKTMNRTGFEALYQSFSQGNRRIGG
jgi:hypothetical protein